MEKTIEERADEYAKSQSYWVTTYDTSLAKHYIAGATEQKAIDIEKACEWLRNHLGAGNNLITALFKAMMENKTE